VVDESPFAEPAASLPGALGPAQGRRPRPGVRPSRAGRGGQLPRLGVGPAAPLCLQRPGPDTV